MKHTLLAGATLSAFLAVAAPRPAHAQFVCANCSTWATQLIQDGRAALSYAEQLHAYALQLSQYQNMVQNTVSLPYQAWNQVQNDILQIKQLSDAGSLLTGNSAGILSRLNNAQAYMGQVGNVASMPQQFSMWQSTIGSNITTMGKTLGIQQGQQVTDAALIRQMQMHSQTADGQMKAIQAGNELASANATELMKVNQTLMETAQMQASNAGVAADRRATEDAARLHFAEQKPQGYGGTGW